MLLVVLVLSSLGLMVGIVLGLASTHLQVEESPIVQEIESLLPGSQCAQCGFAGCGQAAQALADGSVPVTLCPPGGSSLATKLAAMLGVPFDSSALGGEGPRAAVVQEDICIGCMKCFKECPTDAIVGAPKQIHWVLTDYCTACSMCVEVCPTESIRLHSVDDNLENWRWPSPEPRAA